MRIAFISERARGSGAAEAAWNLATALQENAHTIDFLYAESSAPAQTAFPGAREIGRWQHPNREIRHMKQSKPGTRPWLDAQLRRRAMLAGIREKTLSVLADAEPDVVHLHNIAAIGGHVLASSVLRRWPTVWTAHDRYPFELFHNSWEMHGRTSTTWEYSPAAQPATIGLEMFRAAPVGAQFLTPSRWLADHAATQLSGSTHRIEVVPNLIPASPMTATSSRLADDLCLDLVALAVIPKPDYALKGYKTIRQAIETANQRLGATRIGLVVTTANPLDQQADGVFATPELFERGLVPQSGYLDKQAMAALYRAVDVVTISSWAENMPNVAVEAAAAGRPLVATEVGGVPEIVQPNATGWLVDPGDHEAVAEALIAALDDKLRAQMGAASRAMYDINYNPEVVAAKHLETYSQTIQEWRGDHTSRARAGIDLGVSAFRPPQVPVTPRPRPVDRYRRAAIRRLRAAPSQLRRWYSRRFVSRV